MATKLSLYNEALRLCRERRLASVSEDREPRRLLDDVWDEGAVNYVLGNGYWHFAMRTQKLDYSPSVEPPFGYRRAFNKPDDLMRTYALCSDEFFTMPLNQYQQEQGYWFCNLDIIYIRYVSNDPTIGAQLSTWTPQFAKYAAAYLASEIVGKLSNSKELNEEIQTKMAKMLSSAKNQEALEEPSKPFPASAWVNSRGARRHGGPLGDRGNSGNLIG